MHGIKNSSKYHSIMVGKLPGKVCMASKVGSYLGHFTHVELSSVIKAHTDNAVERRGLGGNTNCNS